MNLIENLKRKISNENKKIVFELSNYILDNKITTLEELTKKENELFTYNGKVLNAEERINYCLDIIKYSSDDYDLLTFEEIQVYKRLKNELQTSISIEQKILNLILIFSMTNRDILFLTETYNFILSNKI